MATAHRSRLLRPVTVLTAALGAAVAVLAGPVVATSASPQLTLAQVESRVNALNTQAEKVTEAYNAARDNLTALQRQRRVAGDQLVRERAALVKVQNRIGAQANLAYRNGGLGGFVALVDNPDPANFLDQSAILDEVSRYQSQQLLAASAARHNVAAAEAAYSAEAGAAAKTLARISADRARIDGLLGQAQRLLSSLRAADRARLAAQTAAGAAAQLSLRGSYNGPASGRAAAAVRFAYAQLGKPYQYGAAGPNSYDCSGLTMRAWGAAGVSLPHNAAAQQGDTRSVSYGNLQPGDLTFFGSPAYHVAIYIGNGNVIAAPHTGDVVKIERLSSMGNYSGAGRP